MGDTVAIEVIHGSNAEEKELLAKEITFARTLQSPHLVDFLGMGMLDSCTCLVMPVHGGGRSYDRVE